MASILLLIGGGVLFVYLLLTIVRPDKF